MLRVHAHPAAGPRALQAEGRARVSRPPRWPPGCRRLACSGCSLEQEGRADQFRFGRELDGAPATPWG